MSGLSAYAPEDPESEFVDIDEHNFAVVTLQENNHVAIVNLVTGNVTFDAGSSYEEIAVRFGHYPEERSENKGSEPESLLYRCPPESHKVVHQTFCGT